jgi:hypothetical protein
MMVVMVPAYVTHYYRRSRGPFQNLSDLGESDLNDVIRQLTAERHLGQHHRLFGRKYVEMRRDVEKRLYEGFVERGGRPERRAPHYFVLGDSEWFAGLADDMDAVHVPLSALPETQTSATYGDSFTATGVGPETGYGSPNDGRTYRHTVYLLTELSQLIDRFGLPRLARPVSYQGYERETDETFIEIQLWTDDPIRDFLNQALA